MSGLPYIAGFSFYVPPHIVTNKDLESVVDTTAEWIETRTGIRQRHCIADTVSSSDLMVQAAKACLEKTGCSAEALTHIVSVTCTADANCPPTACLVGKHLGIKGQMAFDINAACTGFITGLDVVRSFLHLQKDALILLVAGETLTRYCNWQDRSTCVLFGDGAGAVLCSNTPFTAPSRQKPIPQAQIVDAMLASDGAESDMLFFGNCLALPGRTQPDAPISSEYFIHMNGREVFKHAVRNMTSICEELLQRNKLSTQDISVFVPHQANLRIIEAVGNRLQIAPEKVFTNLDKYGNTSAASIPIALSEAITAGRIQSGDTVLLTSFGGGFTWGAVLLQFV